MLGTDDLSGGAPFGGPPANGRDEKGVMLAVLPCGCARDRELRSESGVG
jgi:hypothetical protein